MDIYENKFKYPFQWNFSVQQINQVLLSNNFSYRSLSLKRNHQQQQIQCLKIFDHVKFLLLTTYLQQITLCQKKNSHSENLVFKKSCSASNKQKHLKHLTRKHKKGTKINHTVKMIVCPKSRSFFSHIFIKVNLPLKRFNQYLNKQNSTACQNFLDYRL